MKKLIVLIISIFIGVLVYSKNEEIVIPSDAIRVRVIANSNSIKDLYQKQVVKEEIKENLYNLIKNASSTHEASSIILRNIGDIQKTVSEKVSDFTINYGKNYFPRKVYKKVVYPEGEYESLVITIGSGIGDNWWCVLYPPLCMIEDNSNTSDVEYRFLISDLLNY